MSWALVSYATEAEYRAHFEATYCQGPVPTFDGYNVRFRKADFDHCFFESSLRNRVKDTFSLPRAERINWIAETLADASAQLKAGWDRDSRRYRKDRRVALVKGNYVVIIALKGGKLADFVTAYVMDTPESLKKLKALPRGSRPLKLVR